MTYDEVVASIKAKGLLRALDQIDDEEIEDKDLAEVWDEAQCALDNLKICLGMIP